MISKDNLKYAVDLITSIAIVMACAFVIWVGLSARAANKDLGSKLPRVVPVEDIADKRLEIDVADAPSLGNPWSAIALIEFSDFECPFCRRFAQDTFDQLKKQFIESGVISYSYIHHPLTRIHPTALTAATIAECASDQGKFWDIHAGLFRAAASPSLTQDAIASVVSAAHLDEVQLATCLPTVEDRIRNDLLEAQRIGIRSTPTFLLGIKTSNGHVAIRSRINGAQPFDVFVSAIDGLRKQMSPGGS